MLKKFLEINALKLGVTSNIMDELRKKKKKIKGTHLPKVFENIINCERIFRKIKIEKVMNVFENILTAAS